MPVQSKMTSGKGRRSGLVVAGACAGILSLAPWAQPNFIAPMTRAGAAATPGQQWSAMETVQSPSTSVNAVNEGTSFASSGLAGAAMLCSVSMATALLRGEGRRNSTRGKKKAIQLAAGGTAVAVAPAPTTSSAETKKGDWLKLAGHPCSWGVDYADHPANPPWEKVIELMAEAGYTGTDLGPVGYYDPERLEPMLDTLNLDLVAGNIFEKLHEPDQLDMILEKTHTSCKTLQKFGAKFFVIVPHTSPEKEATAGRPDDAPRLPDDIWNYQMSAIKKVAEVVKSYGICCLLHPHAGSWIEYEDEMERALADLPSDLVSLCLDTGHCTYAGMDPVEKFKKHAARIPYMQLKDIDGAVLKQMQEQKGTFWDGVTSGIFCILGQGVVNYPALLREMKDYGFSGYATIEQDFDNKIDDEERKLHYPAQCSTQSVKYLRTLAEQIDEAELID